jgi:hypothetical protein
MLSGKTNSRIRSREGRLLGNRLTQTSRSGIIADRNGSLLLLHCLTLLRDTAYSAVEENLRAFRGPDWVTRG